jgi:pimeloyl-ACP methyl ester carboxylesterase
VTDAEGEWWMIGNELDFQFSVGVDGGELIGRSVGAGEPLLVLHGGPGLSDYSDLFIDELAGWRALCYTQRGMLPSTARGPYTVAKHVEDALAVLDHHGVERAVVLGHSWGACLACLLAAAAPERVRGLVLVDGLGMTPDDVETEFVEALIARTPQVMPRQDDGLMAQDTEESAGEADATESLRRVWPAYFADPVNAPAFPDTLRLSGQCNIETFESLRAALHDSSTAVAMRAFTGLAEVVYGDASPMPARAATGTAAMFTDAAVTAIPGAGHLVWFEQPGSVKAALDRLSRRLAQQR